MEDLLQAIEPYHTWIYLGAGVAVVLVLLALFGKFLGRKPRTVDPERHLRENLTEYPPAPDTISTRRLFIQQVPVRVRLIVLAPAGKQNFVDPEAAADILNQVLRELGALIGQDRPRVRVWPAQLSNRGFAPTFHRLVSKPDPEGKPSHWVLAAGQARAGGTPILLGIAGYAEKANNVGRLTLEANDWPGTLRIE